MFERKQSKQLNHERFNSLFSKSKTYRPLFKDVDTFDDLLARNTDIEPDKKNLESTERVIKKPSKLTIIEPTFINFLSLATKELKELYNEIKNIILSYDGIVSIIEQYSEQYKFNDKTLFKLSFVGNYIQVVYNKVTYNIDALKKVKILADEIQLLMTENKISKKSDYIKVDYTCEFPQLENCIIMDEEIVGNLPFKVLKK